MTSERGGRGTPCVRCFSRASRLTTLNCPRLMAANCALKVARGVSNQTWRCGSTSCQTSTPTYCRRAALLTCGKEDNEEVGPGWAVPSAHSKPQHRATNSSRYSHQ